jgi:hypothetical protein
MSEQRTFDDPTAILDAILRQSAAGLCVLKIARVERYDAKRQRCDAQPLYRRVIADELGERTEQLPVCVDVPVAMPGCGGLSLQLPLAQGDTVLLVFADHSLDRMRGGGVVDPKAARDPGAARSHHLSDAIAIPIAGALDGSAQPAIEIKRSGEVHVGGDQPLVTRAEFLEHTHPDPTSGVTGTPVITIAGTSKLRG